MTYITQDNIKVKIKLVNSGNLLAIATVILHDVFEVHGWRIMRSKKSHAKFLEAVWIQAPSYKTEKGWKEIVYIDDRNTWEFVHEMIYDAYCMERSKKMGLAGIQNQLNSEESEVKSD